MKLGGVRYGLSAVVMVLGLASCGDSYPRDYEGLTAYLRDSVDEYKYTNLEIIREEFGDYPCSKSTSVLGYALAKGEGAIRRIGADYFMCGENYARTVIAEAFTGEARNAAYDVIDQVLPSYKSP